VGFVALGPDGGIATGDAATLTVTQRQSDGTTAIVDVLQVPFQTDTNRYGCLYDVAGLKVGDEYSLYVGLYFAASVYVVTIAI
jgi:hypothetical protein